MNSFYHSKISVVINYQKGGEGCLEWCMDLGGAYGLRMDILFDLLPLVTHELFMSNFVLHCTFMSYVLHELCDLNLNLACNMWWTMLACNTLVVYVHLVAYWGYANLFKLHIIYILYVVLPRFPLVRETPSKILNFIYMCSWYSFKSISTYQEGVLTTHRT